MAARLWHLETDPQALHVPLPARVGAAPVFRPFIPSPIADLLSSLDGPRGSGHPDPDFVAALQYSQHPRSRSTSRSNAPCHGFHDSSR